mgnify:CR=1 FL=1
MNLLTCPRCQWAAYENRASYDVCFNCNYSSEAEELIPIEAIKNLFVKETNEIPHF